MKADANLSTTAQQFVDSVLAIRPKIAVFDCDGTLWSGDSGADFFYWEIERGLIPPDILAWVLPRYEDYKAGNVVEEVMCGEMVTINAGLRASELEELSEEFFARVVSRRIFPEMLRLTQALAETGCDLWAVSSTNEWAVRAGVKRFGIPEGNVLAAAVEIENGLATGRLVRVPSGLAKATAIQEIICRPVDVVLGNSIYDLAMLEMAGHAVAVNPNPDLEKIALEKAWKIYWPETAKA